ncbi:MAG: hypothetical protein H6737_01855 [Alphaproteobacteria bacterium]|nr:hypothetical protein [Alphaproteobacteria bacterium]
MAEEEIDGPEAPLDDCEILAFKVEMTLVPEWSNLVERICTHHGERVAVALEGDQMVVKVAVKDENKPGMLNDLQNFWDEFARRRKLEGRWTPR